MFKYLFLFITLMIFKPVFSQELNQEVEKFLYSCLGESFEKEGVDLNSELDRLEKFLIQNGDISEVSGDSYLRYFLEIQLKKDVLLTVPPSAEEFSGLLKLDPGSYYSSDCLEQLRKMNSQSLQGSSYFLMSKALAALNPETITPEEVSKAISGVLEVEDFETPFYRALTLLTMLNLASETPLVSESAPEFDTADYFVIPIFISGKDELFLSKNQITPEDFRLELAILIEQHPDYYMILEFDRKSSYNFYGSIRKEIANILGLLAEEASRALFDKEYSALDEAQQLQINTRYSFRIKENIVEK
jgi:hypothetical protein